MIALGGVDEAGFGPLLGPLCIGYAMLALPAGATGPRALLRPACASDGDGLAGRLVVCDSKLLHRGPHRLKRLERTALAFLTAARGGRMPETTREALAIGTTKAESLAAHPWYADLDVRLPLRADRDDVQRSAEALMRTAERAGFRILELGTRVLPELELNELFSRTNNKSLTLFESILPVLERIRAFATLDPVVVCDRHGGRASYAPLLARAFPSSWVAVARQTRRESLYRVKLPDGRLRVVFTEGGESRSFACALASCLAKYARELSMERWNQYFSRIAPGVRATAGYTLDARRYLREAKRALASSGIDPASYVRAR